MKQGELGGILKELGYTEDQVNHIPAQLRILCLIMTENILQVYKF